ncbi:MAG: hypothetical protein GY856_05265 [bacterium]|nr:hypothetical protein [bacterium]
MTKKASLREETGRVWKDASPLRRGSEPPAPGDVVVLERTARFDVEWAVLSRDPEDLARLLVVAADGQPLVGSADVEIPISSPAGPLTLRCRFGGWIDAGRLTSPTHTGSLSAEDLARARQRRNEVERDAVAGSVVTQEVDDDPEYLDWVAETLEPAWHALAAGGRVATASGPETRRPRSRRRQWGSRRVGLRPLALAATLILALGGGLFQRQHRQHQQELEEMRRRSFVVNPAVVTLLQDQRSVLQEPMDVRLPTGASHVVFFFLPSISDPEAGYRAELLDPDTDELLWASDELREVRRELRIGLPTGLLSPGEYRLRIFKLGDGEPMAEYPLHILDE